MVSNRFPSNFHRGCGYISVSLVDYVKLLGVTFNKHLNFDKHISNFCSSSSLHNRALRHSHPFLDSETSKTIAGDIVGSRLDYIDSILTGISSRNTIVFSACKTYWLDRVVTRSTTKTTSALKSLHWLPIQQRTDFKLATLVHRSLHNAAPQYIIISFTTSLYAITSASLCLPQSSLPTSY